MTTHTLRCIVVKDIMSSNHKHALIYKTTTILLGRTLLFIVAFFSVVEYGNYQYGRPFTGSPTLTMTSNSSPSLNSSIPESDRECAAMQAHSGIGVGIAVCHIPEPVVSALPFQNQNDSITIIWHMLLLMVVGDC